MAALANRGISVFMVAHASSENSTSIGVRDEDADQAAQVLNETFAAEIEDGAVRLSDDHATLCDVRLSGNLSGFLQLFKKPTNSSTPPRGKLYIEGDLHAAQQFQRVMGELAPDFDAVFRERFGERLGSTLADAARRLQAHGEAGKAAIEAKLRAYISENGCATRSEAADFARRLQALTARLARLETRLATEN